MVRVTPITPDRVAVVPSMARHSSGNGVDSESDILTLLSQQGDHLGNWVLALGNSEAVAGDDDDVLGVNHGGNGLVVVPDSGSSGDLHGLAGSGVSGSESSKDDVGKRSVHGDTHDVGENGSRGSNERSNNGHEVVVQHESLSTESPAGVGVQYGDDDRHVRSTNGHGQSDSHHAGQGGGGAEHGQAGAHARVVQEVSHGSHVGRQQTGVESVSAGQHEGVGAQVTVQLAVGDQRSSEGDSTNVCTKEGGGLDHGG